MENKCPCVVANFKPAVSFFNRQIFGTGFRQIKGIQRQFKLIFFDLRSWIRKECFFVSQAIGRWKVFCQDEIQIILQEISCHLPGRIYHYLSLNILCALGKFLEVSFVDVSLFIFYVHKKIGDQCSYCETGNNHQQDGLSSVFPMLLSYRERLGEISIFNRICRASGNVVVN